MLRNSAWIEQLLTVVNSHHCSNLQTVNSLCKGLLADASSFAGPEHEKLYIQIPSNLELRTVNAYDCVICLIILIGFREKINLLGLIHIMVHSLLITLFALQPSKKHTCHLQFLGSLPQHHTIFRGHGLVKWKTHWIKAED